MKCTSCELPLSPTHTPTNCPRCGTPTDAASIDQQSYYQQPDWESSGVVDAGVTPAANYQWEQNVQGPPVYAPPQQQPKSGQMWSGQTYQPGYTPSTPPQFVPSTGPHNSRLGFILAGLCILAGGLILLFVYFSATGLPGSNSSTSTSITSTSTPNVSTSTPTTAPTATAVPSQTATTYPGQQYIDNAQMSATVDPTTLQPSQVTTTFKTNQKIYVSFQVHPNGHTGAVCLIWYLNSKPITNFSLPVSSTSKYSYGYSLYGGAGPAYVELYWASSTQCTDQVLAQHVDFTVTN
ncbi:MAG: hypothetical protein ACXWOL_05170 [Ktedonobacteraceae bacterium]